MKQTSHRIRSSVPRSALLLALLASPTLAQLPPLVETLHEPFLDPSNEFGHSVAAGDVNGDGFDDVLVGATHVNAEGVFGAGEAFDFLGAGLSTVLALSEPTPETRAKFGHSIASGDVTGDGPDELLVGATYELFLEPGKALVFVPRFDLALNALSISASEGGSVVFSLNSGRANGGRAFQLWGSNSGTDPCTPIGSVCVPIVTDAITLVLQQPPYLGLLMGTLDADGKQTVSVPVPPGLLLSFVGTNSFWAYPLFNPGDYASNPVVLEIAN